MRGSVLDVLIPQNAVGDLVEWQVCVQGLTWARLYGTDDDRAHAAARMLRTRWAPWKMRRSGVMAWGTAMVRLASRR